MRVSWSHDPSKRTASGKNSQMDGAWNPSDDSAFAMRLAASVNSAGSSFGATV